MRVQELSHLSLLIPTLFIPPHLEVGQVPQDLLVVLVDAEGVEVALDGLAVLAVRAVQEAVHNDKGNEERMLTLPL